MDKEALFSLIRQEDVVVWIGSGFSYYAGYPIGGTLSKILMDNLSEKEREQINPTQTLPGLSEEFYRLKSRNTLIRILNKIYHDHIPSSTVSHDLLSKIPHFKTIITTNYDKLIENAYANKGQVILSINHIPYIDKNKVQIFKVHGDLSNPDSIVITQSDYNNFFKNDNENNVYWNVIKERLSTNSVLFIGYSLEDPNASIIFDKIYDAFAGTLGNNRKECFLVAPNLPNHKINDLIKKGIHYINSTGEELINDLFSNLKETIIEDFENNKISPDTFREFISNFQLASEIRTDNEGYQLRSLRGLNEKVEGNITLTLKNDKELLDEFKKFVGGEKFGNFTVLKDDIVNIGFKYGELKLPYSDGIEKIEFQSLPKVTSNIDIRFENGFELGDISIKLFFSSTLLEIEANIKTNCLKYRIALPKSFVDEAVVDFSFEYEPTSICKKVKDGIEFYTLLSKLTNGDKFKIYSEGKEVFSKELPYMEPIFDRATLYLDYYNNLKFIEQYFNIRFSDIGINSITNDSYDLVTKIIYIINGKDIEFKWNGEVKIELSENSEEMFERLKKANQDMAPVTIKYNEEEEIELHGQKINIGYKTVDYLQTYISNLDSILNGETNIALIRSKNKRGIVRYSKTKSVL
ncbi:MAG TPA: SIR2 family protein [Cytophagaceae bacterium]|jgi:hypothetical protein|nr:SIR2 family protein [Cytophagaceae bacterium]